MFYVIFNSNPVFPPKWCKIHLWVAQVFLCSILSAESNSFHDNISRIKLKKLLCQKFNEFAYYPCNCHWYSKDMLMEDLLSGIDLYIEQELENIQKALKSNNGRFTDIDKSALCGAINNDVLFAKYINSIII
jgi:hypothetical protein